MPLGFYENKIGIYNLFTPIAVETLGSWGQESHKFLKELGLRIAAYTIQKGNASSILGTLATTKNTKHL